MCEGKKRRRTQSKRNDEAMPQTHKHTWTGAARLQTKQYLDGVLERMFAGGGGLRRRGSTRIARPRSCGSGSAKLGSALARWLLGRVLIEERTKRHPSRRRKIQATLCGARGGRVSVPS